MDNLREKALGLPALPGVYIMKDRQNRIIYVGKAGRLKNRVSSYFSGTHDAKTEKMTSRVADFDVIITASEFEALILENSLIKHHNPRYNIKLRDDKGYPFIRVDKEEEYPSFKIVSKPEKDSALYLGPYSGRSITREAIGAVCKGSSPFVQKHTAVHHILPAVLDLGIRRVPGPTRITEGKHIVVRVNHRLVIPTGQTANSSGTLNGI